MPKPNMSSSSTPVTWKVYPDASYYNLNMLMAELLQRYMSEYTTYQTTSIDQHQRRYVSTYRCNNEPLRSHIDTIIEGYLQHLPLGAQSKLRQLWQLTYAPFDSDNAYCRESYISCRLSRERQQDGHSVIEGVTLSIPLALLFTLVLQAIQDESAWLVPEGSTAEAEKALRMAQFDWINQHYFTTDHWSSRKPYPWLQLLNGYQGKSLHLSDHPIQLKSTPIDIFLSLERQQQMETLEKVYDEDWQPDNPETWADSFIDYWICAEKSQMEIVAARPSRGNTKKTDINVIQAKLLGILAMLHYRAENNPSDALTQIVAQINAKIQEAHAASPATSSSTSTSVQTSEPAGQASNLAERLATKSLLPEDSMLLTECVAHSPQMPAGAITWLLSEKHHFNVDTKKKAKERWHPETLLDHACQQAHPALVQHLLDIDTSESAIERRLSALRFAAHHQNPTIINLLWGSLHLTQPTDNDKQNWAVAYAKALSEAADRGHINTFRQLLQHFSMLNLSLTSLPLFKRPSVSCRGGYFGSLLLWAVACGHTDIVQSLLDCGASMHEPYTINGENTPNICVTPLSGSALYGQVDSLRVMLNYANTHSQMPDADYIDLLVRQGRHHPAIISLLIERDLFVFSGAAPTVGQIKFPYSFGVTPPPRSNTVDETACQAIQNLAPTVYQPIVQRLIQYIQTRDTLSQPIADYLAEHLSIGYPKAVKLRVAHQMIASLLIGDPDAFLNHLSDNEHNALQQGNLGKIYQAYLQMQTQLDEPSAPFSESQQLWPAHREGSQTSAPAPVNSSSMSASK